MPLLNEWVDWVFSPTDWNPPFSWWWIIIGLVVVFIWGLFAEWE